MIQNFNAFAKQVHAENAHWWHDPATGARLNRNLGEMLMLVVSEIAECMEGERKDLMDTHLPHRKMAEVELADAVIRIADIAGTNDYDLEVVVSTFNRAGAGRHLITNKGEALAGICITLGMVNGRYSHRDALGNALARIIRYADQHGYDLWGAVAEKREYNKHRADHKPEARLAANGKKW